MRQCDKVNEDDGLYWNVLGCNLAVLGCNGLYWAELDFAVRNWAELGCPGGPLVQVVKVFQVIHMVRLVGVIRVLGWSR